MNGLIPPHRPWRVLVVDDEEGIHGITRMIFRGYTFEGRPVELISALSGQQARELLQKHEDVALVLLDVVMESDDEGLRLVDYIRDQLGNRRVRIILRTGHPGYAPETDVIVRYDINDYLSKAELSASRLLTSVVVALRAYRDLVNAGPPAQTATDGEAAPDGQAALATLMRPLLDEARSLGRRLQRFDLNPQARDLLTELVTQQQRLSALCRQLEAQPPLESATATEPRQLIEALIQTLLPLARQHRQLLDYRIEAGVPARLQLCQDAGQQLWLTLLEQAMHCAPDADLMLIMRYQADDAQLELTIQGESPGASAGIAYALREAYWRASGRGYSQRLARVLDGSLELLSLSPSSVLLSCSIAARAI